MPLKCSMCESEDVVGFTVSGDTTVSRYLTHTETRVFTWEARCKPHLGLVRK